jgi:hypothetical protein
MNRLALLLAALLSLPALAVPDEVRAEYRVSTAGIVIGHVVESYARQGDAYRIRSTTRAEGALKLLLEDAVVVESEGRVGPKGLEPLRFERRRTGDPGRDVRASFDWEKSLIRSEHRGERETHALPAGTQDRLSVMYQFMHVPPAEGPVRVSLSNGRKAGAYTYRRLGEGPVATPAGEFAAVHYERVTEGERENRAEVWLARDRFHLPVRVVFEDAKGLRLEQTIVSLETR